ncbi:LOW QUALITY PROTEIN: hypothetical protein NC652_039720 [Populus alba x Populus x berolinensis]|nr:LOW QUALITY PROTEIN: hypothetical protein NC652_039720 [Populus alba x Populus x berolinensis]
MSFIIEKDELRTKRRKARGLRANGENQRTNGENEKNRENPRTEHNRGTRHTEHTRRNELRTNWGKQKQGKSKQTQRGRTNEKKPRKKEDLESYLKNKEDKSPLYLAVESCDEEMIASFIEAMPEGNLEELAEGKPDIMLLKDKKGGNLLHLAASMGFLSGARLLVSRCPVAASQRNDVGNLPIHVACQKGHLEVVRELLAYWFDAMDFSQRKRTEYSSPGSGQMKIVDEILRNRDLEALTNEKDYDGNTPLHLAAMYCRSEIVRALVRDKRVDKRIVNNEKLKPSGVVAKLLRGGRFEAPKSDGLCAYECVVFIICCACYIRIYIKCWRALFCCN